MSAKRLIPEKFSLLLRSILENEQADEDVENLATHGG